MSDSIQTCLCGCNSEVNKRRKFLPGHDAKLKSLGLKIARGEEPKSAFPSKAARDYIESLPQYQAALAAAQSEPKPTKKKGKARKGKQASASA